MSNKSRLVVGMTVFSLLLSAVMPFIRPGTAHAINATSEEDVKNATYRMIDAQTLEGNFGGKTVIFKGELRSGGVKFGNEKEKEYLYSDKAKQFFPVDYDCAKVEGRKFLNYVQLIDTQPLYALDKPVPGTVEAVARMDYKPDGGACTEAFKENSPVKINDLSKARIVYNWTNSAVIDRIDGDSSWRFVKTDDSKEYFLRKSESECIDKIKIVDGKAVMVELSKRDGSKNPTLIKYFDVPDGCGIVFVGHRAVEDYNPDENARFAGFVLGKTELQNAPADPNAGLDASGSALDNSCESAGGLSWILCPIIVLGMSMTDTLFSSIIRPLLEDVPVSSNPDNAVFNAWQTFRTLGNILLVGTLVAVAYAQVRGDK